MTSRAGHIDGMKKLTDNNSSVTNQNQPNLFRQNVHSLVQLLMQNILVVKATHLAPVPFKFNNIMFHIYFCECNSKIFITLTYSSCPWL